MPSKRAELFARAGQAIMNAIQTHVEERVGANGAAEPTRQEA